MQKEVKTVTLRNNKFKKNYLKYDSRYLKKKLESAIKRN
jgi:hypothetical protein